MQYMKVSQAAEKWELSARRVRLLCQENRINGVIRKGNLYMIPITATKPQDGRSTGKSKLELKKLLNKIDENSKKFADLRPLTQGEAERLREEFLIEFTYNSNAIEGNKSTLRETAMLLEEVTLAKMLHTQDLNIIAHRDAFEYMESLTKKKIQISDVAIKNIHYLILAERPEDKGKYRKIPVRIMGGCHESTQPNLIEPMITDLLVKHEQRKQTMHFIEAVALFHLDFESIHPFIDGNGRTGRILINFELMKNGYPTIDIKFTDIKKYYQAFDAYYRNQNEVPMVELLAKYINERLEKYIEMLF